MNIFPIIKTDLLEKIHRTYRRENITVEFSRKRYPVIFHKKHVYKKIQFQFQTFLVNPSMTEANQWTGFYMITASVMKGLIVAN